eukprot:CAMPEP_0172697602 /NCGR_PEP_ID=MMETSP1074-20121228/28883_1 /TAXON_ID=2916 /ORGANISM="Ceratium fusus, Strain PA161109" /LENGTH=370 /DNA_ID=CAMNT_0013518533 /DNA_START=38 /DNA_END=1150 /DNA_ORIENTATION=-
MKPDASGDGMRTRWGIVGCGDVTERKSGPGLQAASGSEVHAVMRRDAAKAEDYAWRHGVAMWTADLDTLLACEQVDAVYLATPPGNRIDIANRIAAVGKPCYMEKPMARNFAESLQIAQIFSQARLPLFVAYYRRAYPRYQQVKALLENNELGELSSVQYLMRRRPQPANGWRHDVAVSGGGLFVDVGSHLLDLLDFLLGPLKDVKGTATRASSAPATAPEDVVVMNFTAGQAAAGCAIWNFRASDDFESLELVGDRARLVLPEPMNGSECIIEFADGSPSRRWAVPPPCPAVQQPLIQTVVDALQMGNPSLCLSTAESALRTAKCIDVVLEDFYGPRENDFWKDPSSWPVNTSCSEARDVDEQSRPNKA